MALIDDFKSRFPEFDSGDVDQYFPVLQPMWPCYYGGNIDDACDREIIFNLIAHLMVGEISDSQSASRAVGSKSVGSVSVSYQGGDTSPRGDYFNTTKYGARFLQLTQKNTGARFV
jgi:hypothetical protein